MRLIGVGLETLGVEEFLEGKFFAGELFVDESKESFQRMGFKQLSYLEVLPSVFSNKAAVAFLKAIGMNVGGNIYGDGFQNGGCLVVGAGGSPTLYTFKQLDPTDHPENEQILKALGIASSSITTLLNSWGLPSKQFSV